MTKIDLRRGSDRKQNIVHAIVTSRVRTSVPITAAETRLFLGEYVANVPVSDLEGRDPKVMAQIALRHLEFGAKRRRGQSKLRIFNPNQKQHGHTSAFTFIELIQAVS